MKILKTTNPNKVLIKNIPLNNTIEEMQLV